MSLVFLIFFGQFLSAQPKYGPHAAPLSRNTNAEYFRSNKASDFWALIPFYVGQENESSCSAATLVTVLNASRKNVDLTSQDELLTHKSLVEKYTDEKYMSSVSGDTALAEAKGVRILGVTVERLAEVLNGSLPKLFGNSTKARAEFFSVGGKKLVLQKKKFHDDLVRNENSSDDFVILNFTQGILTGDPEGMVGHIAAVGAYDEKHRLVLILDPDRKWYEPYWSPEDEVWNAVKDSRSDAKSPGYVYLRTK